MNMTSREAACCRAHAMLLKARTINDRRSPLVPDALIPGYVVVELGENGTFVTRDDQTRRLADFTAAMCSWSMFLSDESAFIHVLRHGQFFQFEITLAEQESGSWILDRLGAEAAASVPRYTDLVGVIIHFSVEALRKYHGGASGQGGS
jgi:hypothetical protein